MLISQHAASAQHLQLGEGLLLANADVGAILASQDRVALLKTLLRDERHVIGATREGCVFHAAPELLHTEGRGQRTPAEGSIIPGKWKITLSGTMLEVTNRNLGRLLNLQTENSEQSVLFMPPDGAVAAPMQKLCWIGSCADGVMAIELMHPVSTAGLQLRTGYRGTGEMPFCFMATQGLREPALPFRIYLLREVTVH